MDPAWLWTALALCAIGAGCAQGLVTDAPDASYSDGSTHGGSVDAGGRASPDATSFDASASDDAGDDAGEASTSDDGGSADAAAEGAPPAPCVDGGLGGIGIPAGTIAAASGSYQSTPANTIDGSEGTCWNSGGYTGTLTLTLPGPQSIDGVRLSANAYPACSEPYTITGYLGGSPTVLANSVGRSVPSATTVLPDIVFAQGTYDRIDISVGQSSSWIVICEVALLTPGCM